MKLLVKRFEFGPTYTIGKLYIDGVYECFTLEDKYREVDGVSVEKWKVQNETAIPKGQYKVILDNSIHFHKVMPHILDVPGYSGVRIHSGNDDKDTEGCILVGQTWAGTGWIGNSRAAYDAFFDKIRYQQDITISIE